MNYEIIKAAAQRAKLRVSDFLALSPGNDPFYCGAPGQMEKARWFGNVYELMGEPDEVHVRRVHYWLVSQQPRYKLPNGDDYLNNDKCWSFVSIASKYARYAGVIPMENIIDRRNPPAIVNNFNWSHKLPSKVKQETDCDRIIDLIASQFYCFNASKTQSYLMEIWCEKSTMNDVLEPICRTYGMNLVTGLGELSITAVRLLMERVERACKPTRIFYISDFDPAGEGMPISVSRKIEYFVSQNTIFEDIKLIPIMLTAEQCQQFKLPRTPIKASNLRKGDFEERHGAGATELDALEALYPGRMAELIREIIDRYFDYDKWNAVIDQNKEIKKSVREYLTPLMDDLLSGVLKDLPMEEFDRFTPLVSENVDDGDEPWLYDSGLTYSDQLEKYKEHKQG